MSRDFSFWANNCIALLVIFSAWFTPTDGFTIVRLHPQSSASSSCSCSWTRSSSVVTQATLHSINGEKERLPDILSNLTDVPIDDSELLPLAPAVTYKKFITMQDKRVVVTIRYSGEAGLRPYFLTVAKKLKQSHPDVIVERRILPAASLPSDAGMDSEATFEILVDGTVVVGKNRARRAKVARVDMSKSRSVYVSMQELDVAIARGPEEAAAVHNRLWRRGRDRERSHAQGNAKRKRR